MSERVHLPESPMECQNWIAGRWSEPSGKQETRVISPWTGQTLSSVRHSAPVDVDRAVQAAYRGFLEWSRLSIKDRSQVLFRFREVLIRDQDRMAHRAAAECGKLVSEARAGLMKGVEVLEYALSLQNLDRGGILEVSKGIFCESRRVPLGVVAGVTPFNFPAMVPMWMIPIALALGNAFVWKPSDKTPLTSLLIAEALREAGLPDGAFTIVQGGRQTVESLIEHPRVSALGFVGSTPVAKEVYRQMTGLGKRCLALGGAKNHIVLMPDADPTVAVPGILNSFTGCAGQRCMAASVLLVVDGAQAIVRSLLEQAGAIRPGVDMGAMISRDSLSRLHGAIERAEKDGAQILLDGRQVTPPQGFDGGFWLGPTLLDGVRPGSAAATQELFGPVLSIVHCKSLSEALEIQRSSVFGNAASIFTQNGAVAEKWAQETSVGMVGVNIGVPVPREPFSFGGVQDSKFGQGDITGDGALPLWSDIKKITKKWELQKDQNWMS